MTKQESTLLNALFATGDRVRTLPHTDSWMRGDRYGNVVSVGAKYVHVLMDVSGKRIVFRPDSIEVVDAGNRAYEGAR